MTPLHDALTSVTGVYSMIEHLSSASGVTKVNGILRNIDSFDVHLNADLAPSLILWFRLVVRNSPFAST